MIDTPYLSIVEFRLHVKGFHDLEFEELTKAKTISYWRKVANRTHQTRIGRIKANKRKKNINVVHIKYHIAKITFSLIIIFLHNALMRYSN